MNDRYVCINIIYLLMALCLFFDVIYIICKAKKKNIIGLFAKTLAALCFITIGYLNYLYDKSSFAYYILLGLLLDGLGDLFLALRNIFAKNLMFVIGAISFLFGHIMYIRGLYLLSNGYFLHCIIASIILGAIILYILDRICHFSKSYMILGIIYLTIITMMALLSIGVYNTNPSINNLIFMIGAILFISSDIILVIYNFSKKSKWLHPIYSIIYFVAQILISFSLHI